MSDTERVLAVCEELSAMFVELAAAENKLDLIDHVTATCKRLAEELKAIASRGYVH